MNRMPLRLLVTALAATATLPAAALAQKASGSASVAASTDAEFVRKASASGLAEVTLGQLGASKGNSADTKSFGEQMVKDHTAANDELKSIASGKNLTVSPAPMPADQKAATAMGKKSGDEFDKAFAQKMVADHQKAVALFTKESNSGKDPELKAFATKTLPTLKEHLEMAKKLPGASGSGK
jgi:putative membrane protein